MNSNILINRQPICWKHWVEKNIVLLEDIVDASGEFFNHEQLQVSWLELEMIKAAIPNLWKSWLKDPGLVESKAGDLYTELHDCKN